MKKYLIPLLLLLQLVMVPSAGAVNQKNKPSEAQADTLSGDPDKKMDALSLTAYVTAVTGVASIFLIPALSLLLMPAGLIMGIIGIARGRRKWYKNKRGYGLALAAVVLGGGVTLLFMAAIVIAILTFG